MTRYAALRINITPGVLDVADPGWYGYEREIRIRYDLHGDIPRDLEEAEKILRLNGYRVLDNWIPAVGGYYAQVEPEGDPGV